MPFKGLARKHTDVKPASFEPESGAIPGTKAAKFREQASSSTYVAKLGLTKRDIDRASNNMLGSSVVIGGKSGYCVIDKESNMNTKSSHDEF